jgi:hypothetical protein
MLASVVPEQLRWALQRSLLELKRQRLAAAILLEGDFAAGRR